MLYLPFSCLLVSGMCSLTLKIAVNGCPISSVIYFRPLEAAGHALVLVDIESLKDFDDSRFRYMEKG